MSTIATTDLHLTDKPRDADRWNLFPWLKEQIKKHNVSEVIICGDLTDAKDRHNAILTNRFVDEFAALAAMTQVYLLRGNHDYTDEQYPFFMFTQHITNIHFIRTPTLLKMSIGQVLLIPNTRDWSAPVIPKSMDYIFCHQTFDGAKAENGFELRGIPTDVFKDFQGRVLSGDIHVPQKLNKQIEYIGAPYRVRFGDTFKARVLLLDKDRAQKDLHFPAKGREVLVGGNLEDIEKYDFIIGTQVKIRMRLRRKDFPEWPMMKRQIRELVNKRGWELCGLELITRRAKQKELPLPPVTTDQTSEGELKSYAKGKRLDKATTKLGLKFLEEAKK